MATITPVVETLAKGMVKVTWEGLTENDTAAAVPLGAFNEKCVQVLGTFGSSTVIFEGSNDGGTTFAGLNDHATDAISFTSAGIAQVLETPEYVRPSASGGTSQDVDIILVAYADV